MAKDETNDALALERMRLEQEAKRLDLMERQLALQEKQAATMATQVERTAPRENPNYVVVGMFSKPNGEPWTTDLKCDIYFGPIKLNRTPMTEDEVRAWNLVEPAVKAPIRKVDGSVVYVSVRGEEDAVGALVALRVEVDLKKDSNPQHYPMLAEFARQLASAVPVAA